VSNDVAVTAPAPLALIGSGGLIKSAPAPILVSALSWPGDSETVSVEGIVPAPFLSSTATAGIAVSLVLRAPAAILVARIINDIPINVVGRAPAPRLFSNALSGNLLSAALIAPAPDLAGTGYHANSATMALRAPAPRLSSSLAAAVAAAYRTWVLNTRKGALTEYGPEFAFNSFATFQGQVLACGSSGIVVLGTQALDNAAAITGRVRTGQESFESSFHKRVPRLYVSGTFPGDMLFRTITEGGTRTYSLPLNGITRLQQRRVPVGKGPKSRFWAFEFENVDGADFSVNDLLVYPVTLRRRVQ
jgi:hypothetical protein